MCQHPKQMTKLCYFFYYSKSNVSFCDGTEIDYIHALNNHTYITDILAEL